MLKLHNFPHRACLFWPRASLEALLWTFPNITISFTKYGQHTGVAYSRIGLTRDLYSKENSDWLAGPSMRLITPRTLLALLATSWIWSLHERSFDMVIPKSLKCYYDEKCCSRSLSIPILYLEKFHHAKYCSSISKTSLIFLTTISCLNCPPLPDSVPVELYW